MYLNKKALLSAALILGAASEALANGLHIRQDGLSSAEEWLDHREQTQIHASAPASNRGRLSWARARSVSKIWPDLSKGAQPGAAVVTCPSMEGYPDCHP